MVSGVPTLKDLYPGYSVLKVSLTNPYSAPPILKNEINLAFGYHGSFLTKINGDGDGEIKCVVLQLKVVIFINLALK